MALVEDLGDVDLLSLKDRPFAERLPLYRSAFEQVDKLFYAKPAKDFHLMPPFDAALYRWEQEYFFEYMVEDFLDLYGEAAALRKNQAFIELSQRLGTVARHLVHRDFQSQNLMIKDDKVWLIDFQGLRRGRQEYDLASLVFDPYLDHSAEEREQLLTLWEEIADERPLETLFHECAAQRLMQALGAYGNIVKNRGDEWYRPHIATAAPAARRGDRRDAVGSTARSGPGGDSEIPSVSSKYPNQALGVARFGGGGARGVGNGSRDAAGSHGFRGGRPRLRERAAFHFR